MGALNPLVAGVALKLEATKTRRNRYQSNQESDLKRPSAGRIILLFFNGVASG